MVSTVNKQKTGKIVQIIGSTFDVEFDEGHLPDIYNALTIKTEDRERCGHQPRPARCSSTSAAAACGASPSAAPTASSAASEAVDTGGPVTVPVGLETLGRVFNLLGEPIDGRGPVERRRNAAASTASRRSSPNSRPSPKCS